MVVALLLPPNIHGAASLEAALGSENVCLSVKPYATFRNSSTHVWIPFWGIWEKVDSTNTIRLV